MSSCLFRAGLLVLAACPKYSPVLAQEAARGAESRSVGQKVVALVVDLSATAQVVENFGASDAWSCQYAGNWPASKKEAMADWLFSMDTLDDGRPKGIGLSLWRSNIGAGSAEQGAASGMGDEWRRAGLIINKDKRYDPAGQAGQLWFMEAAKRRGVKQFLGFLNSPPVWLTRNGKAYATGGVSNLAANHYAAFADYIVNVVKGVKKATGITFDYISPVNEPQWDWSDGGQEGSPYTNAEVAGLVRVLDRALDADRLSSRILVPEAGNIRYLLADNDKPGRGGQIDAFFGADSPDRIGGLPHVSGAVAGHSYFSTSPWSKGIALRSQLAAHIDSLGRITGPLSFWQSEYCILGDNAGDINGSKRDTGMTAALYMARVIHNDMVYANAAAWQWWLAISPYDYKDGLIYIDKGKTDGWYHDSKMLWVLGNYSRFVRPGMLRVGVGLSSGPSTSSAPSASEGLFASAYKDAAGKKLIIVLINDRTDGQVLSLDTRIAAEQLDMYTTSDREDLGKRVVTPGYIEVEGRTVNTLVVRLRD